MREILFRGKRIDNGEWVEGYLAAYDMICPDYSYPEDTTNATGLYYGKTPYVGFVDVDPSTVGQYTGLTDKNGERIFEGDIITASVYEREYEDEYLSNTPIKISYCGGYFYPFHLDGCWRSGVSDIEIIGNIHDNPELL